MSDLLKNVEALQKAQGKDFETRLAMIEALTKEGAEERALKEGGASVLAQAQAAPSPTTGAGVAKGILSFIGARQQAKGREKQEEREMTRKEKLEALLTHRQAQTEHEVGVARAALEEKQFMQQVQKVGPMLGPVLDSYIETGGDKQSYVKNLNNVIGGVIPGLEVIDVAAGSPSTLIMRNADGDTQVINAGQLVASTYKDTNPDLARELTEKFAGIETLGTQQARLELNQAQREEAIRQRALAGEGLTEAEQIVGGLRAPARRVENIESGKSAIGGVIQEQLETQAADIFSLERDAPQQTQSLQTIENAVLSGAETGPLASATIFAGNAGSQIAGLFGADFNAPASVQALQSIDSESNKLVIPMVKALGSNPSNADLRAIQSTVASAGKSPAENLRLVDVAKQAIDINNGRAALLRTLDSAAADQRQISAALAEYDSKTKFNVKPLSFYQEQLGKTAPKEEKAKSPFAQELERRQNQGAQ